MIYKIRLGSCFNYETTSHKALGPLSKDRFMAKKINEKTLELNVCAEMTHFFQTLGFHSVWRGLTQTEEMKWGFDGVTSFPNGRLIFIQWKAPKGKSKKGGYKFTLDDEQMRKLVELAHRYPNAVFYGLPQVASWSDYRSQSFYALRGTRFLEVRQLSNHPSLGKQGTHTATIKPGKTQIRVTSIPQDYEALSFASLFGLEAEFPPNHKMSKEESEYSQRSNIKQSKSTLIMKDRKKLLDKLPILNDENYEYIKNEKIFEKKYSVRGFYVGMLFDMEEK